MSAIELPSIGLGTMGGNNSKAVEAYSEAIKMGYRFLDTAQIYFNEKTVGKAIAQSGIPRDDLIVASKVFNMNFTYDKVKRSTEKSLKKLGLNKVDIMYIHVPTRGYKKRKAEILKAFGELIDEEKVGYLGVSNFNIKLMEEVLEINNKPIPVNQVEMHPWLQQRKLLEYLDEKNIKLVSYRPVLRGKGNEVPELLEIAKKHGVSASQVSLAWIIKKGAIPIPKSTNIEHLKDNFESQNLKLDEDDIKKIDSINKEKRLAKFPTLGLEWD